MTFSHEWREERCALTREAAAALLEDLAHIRELLDKADPSRLELRNLSVTLRRLLLEHDLANIAAPRIRRITLLSPDNKPYIRLNQRFPFVFFGSGGATLCGMRQRAILINAGRIDINELPSPGDGFSTVAVRLDNFITQKVLCFQNYWVSRKNAIQHIAHCASGAHSRTPQEETDRVLARIRRSITYKRGGVHFNPNMMQDTVPPFTYNPTALDPVLVETFAAGKYFVVRLM